MGISGRVEREGRTGLQPPVSRPGDHISLQAETEVIAVMSACPQDVTPVNGDGVAPGPLQFQVDET